MSLHPFDGVETITPRPDDPMPRHGNQAYYDWLGRTIEAGTRKPVPWLAVELAITLDRIIRTHEAEGSGGPKCAECVALEPTDSQQHGYGDESDCICGRNFLTVRGLREHLTKQRRRQPADRGDRS